MSDAGHPTPLPSHLSAVPLFPLPNVVLFPRAVLPLHIFEERYKAMTADALQGDRVVAMALLKPGWEKNYYGTPPIDPIVCVGTILSHERLADGKYNFLLQGTVRARVVQEFPGLPYRVAQLQPLAETAVMEIDLEYERHQIAELLAGPALGETGIGRQFRKILQGPLATADVADLMAFNFLDDVWLKQSLLTDTDVRQRVRRTIEAVRASLPELALAGARGVGDPSLN